MSSSAAEHRVPSAYWAVQLSLWLRLEGETKWDRRGRSRRVNRPAPLEPLGQASTSVDSRARPDQRAEMVSRSLIAVALVLVSRALFGQAPPNVGQQHNEKPVEKPVKGDYVLVEKGAPYCWDRKYLPIMLGAVIRSARGDTDLEVSMIRANQCNVAGKPVAMRVVDVFVDQPGDEPLVQLKIEAPDITPGAPGLWPWFLARTVTVVGHADR